MEIESQKSPLYKYALIYGLIFAGIPTLYNIILSIFGLHLDYNYYGEGIGESYTQARIFLLPVILFIAIYKYRKVNTGTLKLKEAIKLGLWIALIGSIVIISYNLIFRLLIESDFSTKFYDINREQIFKELVESLDYSKADLENHERTNGNLWNSLSGAVIGNFVFTLICSLIIGLVLRKKEKSIKK